MKFFNLRSSDDLISKDSRNTLKKFRGTNAYVKLYEFIKYD